MTRERGRRFRRPVQSFQLIREDLTVPFFYELKEYQFGRTDSTPLSEYRLSAARLNNASEKSRYRRSFRVGHLSLAQPLAIIAVVADSAIASALPSNLTWIGILLCHRGNRHSVEYLTYGRVVGRIGT